MSRDLRSRSRLLSPVLAHIVELLQNPLVASALGLAFAIGLLYSSKASFRSVTADDAPSGLVIAAVSLFARLAGTTLVLWAFKTYLTEGLKPFAYTLAGGFFVLYTVELVRYSRLMRHRRPTSLGH